MASTSVDAGVAGMGCLLCGAQSPESRDVQEACGHWTGRPFSEILQCIFTGVDVPDGAVLCEMCASKLDDYDEKQYNSEMLRAHIQQVASSRSSAGSPMSTHPITRINQAHNRHSEVPAMAVIPAVSVTAGASTPVQQTSTGTAGTAPSPGGGPSDGQWAGSERAPLPALSSESPLDLLVVKIEPSDEAEEALRTAAEAAERVVGRTSPPSQRKPRANRGEVSRQIARRGRNQRHTNTRKTGSCRNAKRCSERNPAAAAGTRRASRRNAANVGVTSSPELQRVSRRNAANADEIASPELPAPQRRSTDQVVASATDDDNTSTGAARSGRRKSVRRRRVPPHASGGTSGQRRPAREVSADFLTPSADVTGSTVGWQPAAEASVDRLTPPAGVSGINSRRQSPGDASIDRLTPSAGFVGNTPRRRPRSRGRPLIGGTGLDYIMLPGRRGSALYISSDDQIYVKRCSKDLRVYLRCRHFHGAAGCPGTAVLRQDGVFAATRHNHPPPVEEVQELRLRAQLVEAVLADDAGGRSARQIFDEQTAAAPAGGRLAWSAVRQLLQRHMVAAGKVPEMKRKRSSLPGSKEKCSSPKKRKRSTVKESIGPTEHNENTGPWNTTPTSSISVERRLTAPVKSRTIVLVQEEMPTSENRVMPAPALEETSVICTEEASTERAEHGSVNMGESTSVEKRHVRKSASQKIGKPPSKRGGRKASVVRRKSGSSTIFVAPPTPVGLDMPRVPLTVGENAINGGCAAEVRGHRVSRTTDPDAPAAAASPSTGTRADVGTAGAAAELTALVAVAGTAAASAPVSDGPVTVGAERDSRRADDSDGAAAEASDDGAWTTWDTVEDVEDSEEEWRPGRREESDSEEEVETPPMMTRSARERRGADDAGDAESGREASVGGAAATPDRPPRKRAARATGEEMEYTVLAGAKPCSERLLASDGHRYFRVNAARHSVYLRCALRRTDGCPATAKVVSAGRLRLGQPHSHTPAAAAAARRCRRRDRLPAAAQRHGGGTPQRSGRESPGSPTTPSASTGSVAGARAEGADCSSAAGGAVTYTLLRGRVGAGGIYVCAAGHQYRRKLQTPVHTLHLVCRARARCPGTARIHAGRLQPMRAHDHPPDADALPMLALRSEIVEAAEAEPHRSIREIFDEKVAGSPVGRQLHWPTFRQVLKRSRESSGHTTGLRPRQPAHPLLDAYTDAARAIRASLVRADVGAGSHGTTPGVTVSPQAGAASPHTGAAFRTRADGGGTTAGVTVSPQTDAASLQTDAASPQTDVASTHTGAASPQTDAASPQTGAASPHSDAPSPPIGAASADSDVALSDRIAASGEIDGMAADGGEELIAAGAGEVVSGAPEVVTIAAAGWSSAVGAEVMVATEDNEVVTTENSEEVAAKRNEEMVATSDCQELIVSGRVEEVVVPGSVEEVVATSDGQGVVAPGSGEEVVATCDGQVVAMVTMGQTPALGGEVVVATDAEVAESRGAAQSGAETPAQRENGETGAWEVSSATAHPLPVTGTAIKDAVESSLAMDYSVIPHNRVRPKRVRRPAVDGGDGGNGDGNGGGGGGSSAGSDDIDAGGGGNDDAEGGGGDGGGRGCFYVSRDQYVYTRRAAAGRLVGYLCCRRRASVKTVPRCFGTALLKNGKLIPRQAHNHPPEPHHVQVLHFRHAAREVALSTPELSAAEISRRVAALSPDVAGALSPNTLRTRLLRHREAAGLHVRRRRSAPLVTADRLPPPPAAVTAPMVTAAVTTALAKMQGGDGATADVTPGLLNDVVAKAMRTINEMKAQRGLQFEVMQGTRGDSELFVSSDNFVYSRKHARSSGTTYLKCRHTTAPQLCPATAKIANGVLVPRQAHNHPPRKEHIEALRLRNRVRAAAAQQPYRSARSVFDDVTAGAGVQLDYSTMAMTLLRDRRRRGQSSGGDQHQRSRRGGGAAGGRGPRAASNVTTRGQQPSTAAQRRSWQPGGGQRRKQRSPAAADRPGRPARSADGRPAGQEAAPLHPTDALAVAASETVGDCESRLTWNSADLLLTPAEASAAAAHQRPWRPAAATAGRPAQHRSPPGLDLSLDWTTIAQQATAEGYNTVSVEQLDGAVIYYQITADSPTRPAGHDVAPAQTGGP